MYSCHKKFEEGKNLVLTCGGLAAVALAKTNPSAGFLLVVVALTAAYFPDMTQRTRMAMLFLGASALCATLLV